MVSSLLNLFRWKNLLIAGATIFCSKYAIFEPAITHLFPESHATMNLWETLLLSLSVMIIAAAGYVINDVHDLKADEINKPKKVIVGKTISLNAANNLYIFLNGSGVLLAAYTGSLAGNYRLAILHVMIAALLWIYSSYVKNTFLIGNVIVALASAVVPMTYFFFESLGYIESYGNVLVVTYKSIWGGPLKVLFYFSLGLGVFGFIISLIREIIKDMQDYKGDFSVGANTIPILLGEKWTKILIQVLCIVLIGSILFALYFWIPLLNIGRTSYSLYSIIFIFLLIGIIRSISRAESHSDYQTHSNKCKLIMLAGVISPFIYLLSI